jgi:hypothetical protein
MKYGWNAKKGFSLPLFPRSHKKTLPVLTDRVLIK